MSSPADPPPGPLSPFEHSVVAEVLAGRDCGTEQPPAVVPGVPVIRGSVVAGLITGEWGALARPSVKLAGFIVEGDIDLRYCRWRGNLDLSYCRVRGALKLGHAHLEGRVRLSGAVLDQLDLRYLTLAGPLLATGLRCANGVYALNCHISGAVQLGRSVLYAPDDRPNRCAVELFRARLGDVFLAEARLYGGLYANGVTVDRNVRLGGASIRSRESLGMETGVDSSQGALLLVGATIGGGLYLSPQDPDGPRLLVDGPTRLSRASCYTLRLFRDDAARLDLHVENFRFQRLVHLTPREWLATLDETDGVGSQPYAELASYCGAIGLGDVQRDVQVALQRRVTRELPPRSGERFRRRLWGGSLGYGYHPGRAVFWLAGCAVLCCLLLVLGGDFFIRDGVASGGTPAHISATGDAFAVALDQVLPFSALGAAKQWYAHPTGPVQSTCMLAFLVLKAAGWALAALALASVTGVLKKP